MNDPGALGVHAQIRLPRLSGEHAEPLELARLYGPVHVAVVHSHYAPSLSAMPDAQRAATFELCRSIVAVGGTIANVGVNGVKADRHLETLWDHNITITTRLVDIAITPMLLKTVRSGRLDAAKVITHRFSLDDIPKAYETFGKAADTHVLRVIIQARLGL